MKKLAAIMAYSVLLTGLFSCQKAKDDINKATEFDMSYSVDVPVPSNPNYTVTTPIDVSTPEISTGSAGRFTSENTTKDLITEIKLTKFNISNASGNLNFLKSISIYLKTASKGETLVAVKSTIPANATSVTADLQDVNIKDYISSDKMQFRLNLTITSGLSSDQNLKIEQTLHVKGKKI